jgi:hypothetical protein
MEITKDPIKCPYRLGVSNPSDNPHISVPTGIKKIYDNILDAVGNTPMVRLNKIP